MASLPTHAVAAVAVGTLFAPRLGPWRPWACAAACAMLPDADVVAFALGIPYESWLGHRGLSHSLAFAVLIGVAAARVVLRDRRPRTAALLALATASHGLLDALTNGGLGVGFLVPLDDTRYFFPWQPIEVSPIGYAPDRFWPVVRSELQVVWLPLVATHAAVRAWRRWRPPPSGGA